MDSLYYDAYRYGFAGGMFIGVVTGAVLYWLIKQCANDEGDDL